MPQKVTGIGMLIKGHPPYLAALLLPLPDGTEVRHRGLVNRRCFGPINCHLKSREHPGGCIIVIDRQDIPEHIHSFIYASGE